MLLLPEMPPLPLIRAATYKRRLIYAFLLFHTLLRDTRLFIFFYISPCLPPAILTSAPQYDHNQHDAFVSPFSLPLLDFIHVAADMFYIFRCHAMLPI